jgi:hypothetical protein
MRSLRGFLCLLLATVAIPSGLGFAAEAAARSQQKSLVPVGQAADVARFERLYWYRPGIENGNPVLARPFRVNAPEAVLHPSFGRRSETRASGMMQILMEEDLFELAGAELHLAVWGGHVSSQ